MQFWQVDAFTSQLFGGNPAAVFLLETPLEDTLMQQIAKEMNLSETTFVLGDEIRWFTPNTRSTCAAQPPGERNECRERVEKMVGAPILYIGSNHHDGMAVANDPDVVRSFVPDYGVIASLPDRGFLLTAAKPEGGYLYRAFFPKLNVPEDPVTGSANTALAPYWCARLGMGPPPVRQIAERGGELKVTSSFSPAISTQQCASGNQSMPSLSRRGEISGTVSRSNRQIASLKVAS